LRRHRGRRTDGTWTWTQAMIIPRARRKLSFINERTIENLGTVSIGRGVSDCSTTLVKNEHSPSLLFCNQFWLKFMVRLG